MEDGREIAMFAAGLWHSIFAIRVMKLFCPKVGVVGRYECFDVST